VKNNKFFIYQLEPPMKLLPFLCLIGLLISLTVNSNPHSLKQTRQTIVLSTMFDQLMHRQINPDMAVERSVNALLKRYPEQITPVLNIAVAKYPQEYEQIICGAIRAEPALTTDVINIILRSNVASIEDIISFAVTEEPAYAVEIVKAAVSHKPSNLENIVRVAIITEPLMAKQIVDSTMQSYPEKILDILAVAIKALPEQVISIVRDTLRISPDNTEVVSIAVNSSSANKAREIISTAVKSGISQESATAAAIAGGALEADIVKINE
jgi:hypothetical protein